MARSKKSSKKIQRLIFLMLITLVLGITATYAWFSTQRDVEIAGMRLNVEVAESLQISLDGERWTQSINIADMRQFYGTYRETGSEGFAIFQAKKVADGGNQNYVPTELFPVSTAGEVSGGKLQFVQGTIASNVDGTQSLTGITACSEADITTDAEIDDKEDNNADHPYLVFDMYLRNISAKESGIDKLELNKESSVFINTATIDDTQQEGKGQEGTGLEYSARVGFVIYGNTVSVTAQDDATLGTVGEQIRGITATNTEVAAIWEPNHTFHTQYVVNNNGRGITALSQVVTTYGIKSAVAAQAEPNNKVTDINADTDANTDGIEDTNANLVAVKTFTTSYGNDLLTNQKKAITDTEGNVIGLKPNQISKVRVYIWLEGQDPDCVDLASTGDKLNINLKLTKETNSINYNTYEGQHIAPGDVVTASTLLAANAAPEYGAYVTNYTPTNGVSDEGIQWRIFHTDGSNIYLIADDYIPLKNSDGNSYIPAGKGGTEVIASTSMSNLSGFIPASYSDYTGTIDIDNNIASKWLSQYTATSETVGAKTIAYLLDTNQWGGFKDNNGYADYAIGGATIELFRDSYNVTHDIDLETQVNATGYQLRWKTEDNSNSYAKQIAGLSNVKNLYAIDSSATILGMWLASPGDSNARSILISTLGKVGLSGFIDTSGAQHALYGARPCICLNSDVQLEKQADGSYLIVE